MDSAKSTKERNGIPMDDVIKRYLDCWNETDTVARRTLIDEVWAADAEYIDPLAEVRGREQIDGVIAAAQSQFPGLVFTQVGQLDAHHRQARFRWALGPEGGESLVEGSDVAVIDEQKKITAVFGFLDKVPA
jgi:SnoaL-like domain